MDNGNLVITALREYYQNMPYTSARLTTQGKANFGVGQQYSTISIEARVKAPGPSPAYGIWGAVWALPETATYGVWPASGEIDFFEIINDMTKLGQGIQFGPPADTNPGQRQMIFENSAAAGGGSWSNEFAVVKLVWTATEMVFSLNGKAVLTAQSKSVNPNGWFSGGPGATANAPFDIPFYLIANIAVGGLYPNGGYTNKYPDANTPFPVEMYIDYVRVLGQKN